MMTDVAPDTRFGERVISRARAVPSGGTWLGLVLTVVGFVLITIAWGKTAGLYDVSAQIPYVMSAGFTGLGLVCIGLTAIAIDVKVRESSLRRAETQELRDAVAEVRALVLGGER